MIENDQTKLTAKQDALIVALLSQPSLVAAARSINVPEVTARRWLKLDAFQKAYRDAQQEKFTDALTLLKTGVSVALKTLAKHMTDEGTPPAVQVRAANIWLDHAMAVDEKNTLDERHDEILKRLDELGVKP